MKKPLSILLILTLVFFLFPTYAYADEQTEEYETVAAELLITKNPTDEHIAVGHNAFFVSRCDNYESIVWIIMAPGSEKTFVDYEAEQYFEGLTIGGIGTDTLGLYHVPQEMNGCRIAAEFFGADGSVLVSEYATLNIAEDKVNTPVITEMPNGATLGAGESVVLTIKAYSPEGNTLKYQWFCSGQPSAAGAKEIEGATDSSYRAIAEYEDSTLYYFCVVTNTDGTVISPSVSSDIVAVVTSLSADAPEETPEPTPAVSVKDVLNFTGNNTLLAIVGVVIIVIVGLIIGIAYMNKKVKEEVDKMKK